MEDFGKRIKELRNKQNLSQEAFSDKIKVHVTHVSRYERDKSIPSLEVAIKMAEVLGISLDEMVYGQSDKKARVQIKDHELLKLFNKTQQLNEDQQKTVKDLLSAFLLKADLTQKLKDG